MAQLAVGSQDHKKIKEEDTFYIGDSSRKSRSRDNLFLDGYTGYDWGDKLSFTVGITYFTGTNSCCWIILTFFCNRFRYWSSKRIS